MGLTDSNGSLATIEKLNASSFCKYVFCPMFFVRRRLPVVLVRLGMAQTLKEADTLVRHVSCVFVN